MTDYKQLCSELVDAYTWCIDNYMSAKSHDDFLVQRAREALAEPEPPSWKEQALEALCHLDKGAQSQMDTTEAAYIIRCALESLPD